jgi:hypothetical protein
MGAFWAAFETRKKNDKEGITAARKKEREEAAKRETTFKEAVEEIIKRGGFVVEAPIIKEIRGKKEVVGKDEVAVLLKKGRSPERILKDPKTGKEVVKGGNEYWEVVELVTASKGRVKEAYGQKVGDRSLLDMWQFREWLREGARLYTWFL